MLPKYVWCEGTGADLIQAYDPSEKYLVHVFCVEQNTILKGVTVRYIKEARLLYVKTRVNYVVMISHDTEYVKWRQRV